MQGWNNGWYTNLALKNWFAIIHPPEFFAIFFEASPLQTRIYFTRLGAIVVSLLRQTMNSNEHDIQSHLPWELWWNCSSDGFLGWIRTWIWHHGSLCILMINDPFPPEKNTCIVIQLHHTVPTNIRCIVISQMLHKKGMFSYISRPFDSPFT